MADSSAGGGGFFAYYRQYARSGVHAASAAALTALGLWASFSGNRWFILLAIAVYILPPVFLYLTGEGDRVPSVVDADTNDTGETSNTGDSNDASRNQRDDEEPVESDHDAPATVGNDADSNRAGVGEIDTEPDDGRKQSATDRTVDSDDTGTVNESQSEWDETGEAIHNSGADSTDDHSPEADSTASATSEDGPEDTTEPGWNEADTPTNQSLLDIVVTRGGAHAVGEGGVVLVRDDDWEMALDDGPTANANPLRGVDATDDGKAIWFAGDSGVLGRYVDGKLTDHSAPEDQTSTWEDVAVTGEAGNERVHLVNGSGELLRGTYENGTVSWEDIEKPGSGSSISSIAFVDSDHGHICDTNQSVYETTDGGETYEEIGIDDANAAFTDIVATDSTVVVAADDGSLFRYDGAVWTRLRPSESALSAVDIVDEAGLAAGDGGAVYELVNEEWQSVDTPTDADLRGVAIGSDTDVAVGSGGTVVER